MAVMSHSKNNNRLESSKEDSKCPWLCTAMKKSTCSLDEEKTSNYEK